jgi:hypothetical protein
MEPAIPDDWPGFVLTFRYGRTEYRIEVADGEERPVQEIQLVDDGERHVIQVPLRRQRRSGEEASGLVDQMRS